MFKSVKEAFTAGLNSGVHDDIPSVWGLQREAWHVGAYFMRAELPAPSRVERGPRHKGKVTIFADGVLYSTEPCDVGIRVIRVSRSTEKGQ